VRKKVEKYNGIVGTHTESSSSRKMEKYNGIVSTHTHVVVPSSSIYFLAGASIDSLSET